MNFGMTEILIILAIIIILFGARRIPELAKSLGSSMKQFKKGMHEEEDDQEKKA
jgi:sec-independent protein translocase protein TatA